MQQPRTVRSVMGASSSNYSEKNIDDKWSSQEWKSGEILGGRSTIFNCIRKPRRHESQNPLSPQTEKYDRTWRPVVCAPSSSSSEWNADKNSSSQEWKSDELMDDRMGRPVVCSQKQSSKDATKDSDKRSVIR